jgi:hypothetical protein
MILRFPTGLYSRQIPQEPEDVGNITYTISNEDPATSTGNFIIFPIAEKLKKRAPKIYTDEQRRRNLGDLIYSISSGGNTIEGRSTKLFEVGQILEFTDEAPTSDVNAVDDRLEIQHNTNILDLEGLGLSAVEIQQLNVDSAALEKDLEAQLAFLLDQTADTNAAIKDLQKTINEANKALSALAVLGENDDIIAKITETLDTATTEQEAAITLKAELNLELEQTRDKLYAISELVR